MFKLYSTDDDRQLPTEYLPCAAITPKRGMALYMTGGKLAVAGGAGKPAEYISMREESAAVAAGTIIPVCRVQKDQIWETTSENASGDAPGVAVDVHTGGMSVKTLASNPDSAFVLTEVDGTTVRGRFVK